MRFATEARGALFARASLSNDARNRQRLQSKPSAGGSALGVDCRFRSSRGLPEVIHGIPEGLLKIFRGVNCEDICRRTGERVLTTIAASLANKERPSFLRLIKQDSLVDATGGRHSDFAVNRSACLAYALTSPGAKALGARLKWTEELSSSLGEAQSRQLPDYEGMPPIP